MHIRTRIPLLPQKIQLFKEPLRIPFIISQPLQKHEQPPVAVSVIIVLFYLEKEFFPFVFIFINFIFNITMA